MPQADVAERIEVLLRAVQEAARRPGLEREGPDPLAALGAAVEELLKAPPEDEARPYRFAIEQAPDAVFWMDQSGRFPYVNEQACRSLGYTREELARLYLWEIDPIFPKERYEEEWASYRKGQLGTQHIETCHRRKDGSVFPVEVASKHFWLGDAEFHVAFVRDISERKRAEAERARLEAELQQAQKLESVGRLAGGVAHEFNNALSVILGAVELVKADLDPEQPLSRRMAEIERAASRARDTTRQLLAFSRKQIISPRPLDLNAVIGETQETLARLIGEDVELRFVPAAALGSVLADHNQIEQVLLNLALNARDAMPAGGRLTIETAVVDLDQAFCGGHPGAEPGRYVLLRVSDDGVGMDADVRARAFEPFFTTKERGQGTGLGLAMVYGIVRQNHGLIDVESLPGHGSSFRIYLPQSEVPPEAPPEAEAARPRECTGDLLLVEDDPLVRDTTVAMLERSGFCVQAADSPAAALALCAEGDLRVDLVLTDVVMPGMSGIELEQHLRALRPGLRVLYMSGYSAEVVGQRGVLAEGIDFIQKPFTLGELTRKVEAMLRRDDRPAAATSRVP